MPRVYERKFDWDEAIRLRKQGVSVRELTQRYGVSSTAIYLATNPESLDRQRRYHDEWQRGGECIDCGARCTRREDSRCLDCSRLARATSVREDELKCSTCKEWKPDARFPRGTKEVRRFRNQTCRACHTKLRRAYRERNKVPCPSCGEPMLAPNEKTAGNRTTVNLCLACYRKQLAGRHARSAA